MIHILARCDEASYTVITVLEGPDLDIEKLEDEWIENQVGKKPYWPYPRPEAWIGLWPRVEEDGADKYYQEYRDYHEKLKTLKIEMFIEYLKTKGFTQVEGKQVYTDLGD